MKLLSVAVPCYNSAAYMRHCVETLLPCGEDIEILLVDDGSKDDTLSIAQAFEREHPSIVRAIHQENKGHGGAVNTGIANASGVYFKVVDSDDWVDTDALRRMMDTMRALHEQKQDVDMLVSNYVYDKVGVKHKKVMRYGRSLPENRVLTWDEVKKLPLGNYIMMHSVFFRTGVLRDNGIALPEHCFYVDNVYIYSTMAHVNTLYYLNVDLYHYFIGREDQSVHESVMIKRIEQQLRVNHVMIDEVRLEHVQPAQKQAYLYHYLEIITVISSLLLLKMDTPESREKRDALWASIKAQDPWLYEKLKRGLFGRLLSLPGRFGRAVVLFVYDISQKVVGFN